MTTNQKIKLNMYLAVRNFGILNEAIVKTIAKFLSNFALLQKFIDEIQFISEAHGADRTGLTIDKNKLKSSLITLALKNGNKLAILARQTNNNTLLNEVRFNESDLLRVPEVTLKDRAQLIYDRVQANIETLSEQGVTADTQKQFMETLTAFNKALATPRTAVTERKKATQQLITLFGSADAAIEIMDLAARSVRDELPDFYNGYKASRTLVTTSAGTISLKANAREIINGRPVWKAVFTFNHEMPDSNGNGHIVKKTSEKGNFQIKSMQPGTYKVIVTKEGYKNKEVSVVITNGERSELNVELERV